MPGGQARLRCAFEPAASYPSRSWPGASPAPPSHPLHAGERQLGAWGRLAPAHPPHSRRRPRSRHLRRRARLRPLLARPPHSWRPATADHPPKLAPTCCTEPEHAPNIGWHGGGARARSPCLSWRRINGTACGQPASALFTRHAELAGDRAGKRRRRPAPQPSRLVGVHLLRPLRALLRHPRLDPAGGGGEVGEARGESAAVAWQEAALGRS